MRRIRFLGLCATLWVCVWPFPTAAQTTSKPAVVGRLHPGSASDPFLKRVRHAFRDGMRALGHVEARTYVLEERFAEGDAGRLPALAAELVRLKPAAILATGSAAVRALKAATGAIPIVMATVAADPVWLGFVASLARPGGNVTGIAGLLEDLNTKQLELLRELVPGLTKVAVLYNTKVVSRERLERTTAAAALLGLTVHLAGVTRAEELETAFEAIGAAKTGGLLVTPDPEVIDRSRARIADLALRHHLPSVFTFRIFAEAGGLLSYSQDLIVLHRRSATYVDKILKGAKPADLPVEQPTQFELVVNLKTAKALGITIPQSILLRADEVIE